MFRQYFKQAWQLLKASPLVSTISIVGTALSIAMIMIVILVIQINVAGFSPETHRNRMIYLENIRIEGAAGRISGGFSSEFARECLYELKKAEAATAYFSLSKAVSIPGKKRYKENKVKYTDAAFWKVFDFQFLAGKPFSEADFNAGICHAVISEKLARELYGRTDIVGETIVFDYINFTVTGVVKDVSEAAIRAHGEVWVPYLTNTRLMNTHVAEGMSGALTGVVLAKDKSQLKEVKEEFDRVVDRYNTTKADNKIIPLNTFTIIEQLMGAGSWYNKASPKDFILRTGGLLFSCYWCLHST
ncbi:MAG: ABC transporter permease [Tannerellaceae bacterium]|nr:ABC transporter permease [Tannerellaceae bacterium]MCD8263622.1 ABC transporter permease [Tannerellaceae bacterium]